MSQKPYCSNCRSETTLIRIVYGLPAPEAMEEVMEKAERGEIIIGGCVVDSEKPLYACKICKKPLPEYGKWKDWWEASKQEDARKAFEEREKDLLGK